MEWEDNLSGLKRIFQPPSSIHKEEEVPDEHKGEEQQGMSGGGRGV
jgi:hypothetical protein